MADKEDESNMTAGAVEGECSSAAPQDGAVGLAHTGDPVVPENAHNVASNDEELALAPKDTAENPVIPDYFQGSVQTGAVLGQEGQVVRQFAGDGLPPDRNIVTSFVETPGIETATTADVNSETAGSSSPATTTIIYVQPDGSFVEGTGLTAEEQRQLVQQLAQQQLVEVTENEAATLFQQPRPPASQFAHGGTLAPSELQQVIDQVSRSQQSAAQVEPHGVSRPAQRLEPVQAVSEQLPACIALPPGCVLTAASPAQDAAARPQPLCIVQNASQQLQNVAKQVAQQQNQSHNGARLVQKKQMETIRIQVPISPPQQEGWKRPAPPLTVLQQHTSPTGPAPKMAVSSPQIIHITPVIGQQQYLLTNPGDPPIQLLLQRPAPLVGGAIPVLHKVPVQSPVNGRAGRPAPSRGPAPALPPSGPPVQKERQKSRRPQRVQTRSGRVSRPPKHKARDYKFIKTEDLADGRQSDSDDYSEISVDEELGEGPAGGRGPGSVAAANVYLSTRTFKCRTCEKSYIGLGGLTRHYRLNPAHGEAEPAAPGPPTGPASAPIVAQSGHSLSTSTNQIKSDTSTNQIQSDPTEPVAVTTARSTAQREEGALAPGPGRPKGRGGRPRSAARSVRRARPGRPPKLPGALQPPQRRARLKEVLQVCDDEDLMEMVLPRLARVMTVWEFLLMKVDKGHASRPHFSDVYREFEQLRAQVKKMAQEHFSSTQGSGAHSALDIPDPQVCQSLGLGDLATRPKTDPSDKPARLQSASLLTENTEREDCKALPPAKRFRAEHSDTDPSGTFQSHSPAAASAAGVDSSLASVEQSALQVRCLVTRLPSKNSPTVVLGSHPTERSSHPQTPLGPPALQAEGPAGSASSHTRGAGPGKGAELNGSDTADETRQLEQVVSSEALPLDHTYRASLPESTERAQNHAVIEAPGQTERAQNHTATQQPGQTERAQNHAATQQPGQTERAQNHAVTEAPGQTERAQNHTATQQPGQTERAQNHAATQQPGQTERAQNHAVIEAPGQTERAQNHAVTEAPGQTERAQNHPVTEAPGQTERAQNHPVTEELARAGSDVAAVAKDLGQQVFIQTEEGLILPGGTLASQHIVIVTNPDGTAMHVRTADAVPMETVPVETVQALLGMDMGAQPEGVLVSENHP